MKRFVLDWLASSSEVQVVDHEGPIDWFNGCVLRGTGEEPGAKEGRFAGFGSHERLVMDATRRHVLLTYRLDGRPAVIDTAGFLSRGLSNQSLEVAAKAYKAIKMKMRM